MKGRKIHRGRKKYVSYILIIILLIQCSGYSFALENEREGLKDISGHWAQDSISRHYEKGHISGYEDGTFKPDNDISLAETLVIFNHVMGLDHVESFDDQVSKPWYGNEYMQASYYGYLEKVDTRVDEPATRMDILNMMNILIDIDEEPIINEADAFEDLVNRPQEDLNTIVSFSSRGYISGYEDHTFRPEGAITRAEMLAMLDNLTGYVVASQADLENIPVDAKKITIINENILIDGLNTDAELYIAPGVDGNITIKDSQIRGSVIVSGGTDEQRIVLENTEADKVIITNAHESPTVEIYGSKNINEIKTKCESKILIAGSSAVKNVNTVAETNIELKENARISNLITQAHTTVEIEQTSAIENLEAKEATEVNGQGEVLKAVVYSDRVSLSKRPGFIEVKGNTAKTEIGETTVNTTNDDVHEAEKEKKHSNNSNKSSSSNKEDRTAPSGYQVNVIDTYICSNNKDKLSFQLTGAEIGTSYNYAITSDSDTKKILGEGRVTSNTMSFSNINVSALKDGQLTVSLKLSDASANIGADVHDTVLKDTNAPSYANGYPNLQNQTTSGFELSAELNEAGKVYYVVVTSGSSIGIASSDVIDGQTESGGVPENCGSMKLETDSESISKIDGLSSDTAYDVYIVAQDIYENTQTVLRKMSIKTDKIPDNSAPAYGSGYPNVSMKTSEGFDLNLEINEPGTAYYVVVTSGSSIGIDVEDVMKGQTANGGMALQNGLLKLSANTEKTETINGLNAETAYNVYIVVKDEEGNTQSAVKKLIAVTEKAPDTQAPDGYDVSIDQTVINQSNENNMSYTFSSAEIGASYTFSIDDGDDQVEPVKGTGKIVTGSDSISDIDVSELSDGTLSLSITLTDLEGNVGSKITKTVVKDTIAPSGYELSFDDIMINQSEATATSLNFTNAEVGASYSYKICNVNDETDEVNGSGTIVSSTEQVGGIDVSGLQNGMLKVTAWLTDEAGNRGPDVLANVNAKLDTVAPSGYSVTINPSLIKPENVNAFGFQLDSLENGVTYNYSIDDMDDGTSAVTGTGTVQSATEQITGIDVSSLSDGVLTLKVVLIDSVENIGVGVSDNVAKDTMSPNGYSVDVDQEAIGISNENALSFKFANAEVGATYSYTIDDTDNATDAITGSGVIVTSSDQVSGINVSGLSDGMLTLNVVLVDVNGNTGVGASDTVNKDSVAPSGYSVSFGDALINQSESTNLAFRFSGAEVGTTYSYKIDDTDGGTSTITGTGTIATESDEITDVDVSGLSDGTLTLTVNLTDGAENLGASATATTELEATAPSGYSVVIDQSTIGSNNVSTLSFTFGNAEIGSTYSYSIDDTDDSTSALTGSGTIVTATDQITGINASGLSDGTLTLRASLTDTAGNVGSNASANVSKDTAAPSGYSVSFDDMLINQSEAASISFSLADAEIGSYFSYSIDDTDGGTSAVIGTGTVSSETQKVEGINVSGLTDDTLTLIVNLTDGAQNSGANVTANADLDTLAPNGYSVDIVQSEIIPSNETALSFKFTGAQVGSTYSYSIDDTDGGTSALTGSGTVITAVDEIQNIDVSTLEDGILTLDVNLTDVAGNTGSDTSDTVDKDTEVPSGYSISFDDTLINESESTSVSFTFDSAEVGTTYTYSIDDTDALTSAITGSGTISTESDQITGIDVSTLTDGTLTLTAKLTDGGGNTGNNVTANTAKETVAPSGYTVSFNDTLINQSESSSVSFSFADAEVNATYDYSIDDTNGATSPVTGTGTITTATDEIVGIDVSGLSDDTLTLTVKLTDVAGNEGANATNTVTKDTTAPTGYSVAVDQTVISTNNETGLSFTFSNAEIGATYYYSIDDTNGVTANVIGNGNIATATDQITGIDVSGLSDDTLVLTVRLTDSAGNAGSNVTSTVTKDTDAPSGYSVSFDDTLINSSESESTAFTFTSAEVGATYSYSIDDTDSGTSAVIGSGTISTATDQITGINISTLSDGILTLTVKLTDTAGNEGTSATATTSLDKTPSSFTSGYPKLILVGSTSVNVRQYNSGGGSVYYVIVPDGDPIPTVDEVLAGQASGGGAPVAGNSFSSPNLGQSGLSEGTAYDMYFVLKDASGNAQTSLTKLEYTTTDVTAPTPGNSGTPTTSNASSNGITVNWTKGTDNVTTQSGLQYLVYYSTSNNISTVSDMESYGTAVGSYAANISTIDITGLSSSTTYYFNLIVKDESDNKTAYSVVSSTTTAEVSYPDGYTANFTNTDGGDPPYYSSMTFTKSGDVNSKPSYTAPYVDDSTGTNQTMTILWDTVDNRWEIHDSIVDSASYDPMTYFHPTNTEISPPLSGWTDDCDFGNITLTEN